MTKRNWYVQDNSIDDPEHGQIRVDDEYEGTVVVIGVPGQCAPTSFEHAREEMLEIARLIAAAPAMRAKLCETECVVVT